MSDRADCGCGCDEARAAMEEYLRRECCQEQRDAISAHLEECPTCSSELEVSERLVTVVRRSCAERAPDIVRVRIVEAIRRTPCGGRD